MYKYMRLWFNILEIGITR